jgi:hypothetical protein
MVNIELVNEMCWNMLFSTQPRQQAVVVEPLEACE